MLSGWKWIVKSKRVGGKDWKKSLVTVAPRVNSISRLVKWVFLDIIASMLSILDEKLSFRVVKLVSANLVSAILFTWPKELKVPVKSSTLGVVHTDLAKRLQASSHLQGGDSKERDKGASQFDILSNHLD